ncbi:MAG: ABC transporter substrate-binding protein, partial [Candidatus Limnocylindrales bacterium]
MSQRLRHRAAVIASSIVLGSVGIVPLVVQAGEAPAIFRIGVTQGARPVELNPFQTTSGMGYSLLADRYDLLVGFGEDLSAAPGLAETWSISDDGLVWTYAIRDGATWQDGQPVTAEDVRFTFQYIIDSHDPAYTGPAAPAGNDTDADGSADNPLSLFDSYLDLDGGLESTRIIDVAAPDATTVTITTSEPLATLSQIFIPILPKHIWETIPYAQSANERIELDQAIGSGPFQIVEFQNAQFMRLIAHDGYWGGRPHIDELIYQYFENDEAQVNALGDGSVDFLDNFPPGLISALEGDPNITINRAPST